MRALAGGFALAFTAGFNVSNVGAVADQVSAAYGVGLAVVGLFTTGLFLTHAGLEQLDLPRDGGLGEVQLFSGEPEVEAARQRLEGPQRAHGQRAQAQHAHQRSL